MRPDDIKETREALGISQEVLAERSGVSLARIRQFEQGLTLLDRMPSHERIHRALNELSIEGKALPICCSGMRGYLERGWASARNGIWGEPPDPPRIYFIIYTRGKSGKPVGVILSHCPMCGKEIYPGPKRSRKMRNRHKTDAKNS